jgi:cytochrome P450
MSEVATLNPGVSKPAHVPDALVYDFDMFADPGYLANPHDRILDMIANAPPVFWTPRNGGHWMAISHGANFKASRDVDTFTSQFITREQLDQISQSLPGNPHIPMATPINLDPPEHTKYRAPLQKVFSPKAVLALKEDIRAIADRLLGEIADRGHCEFQEAVAERMPVEVFLKMFGLPLDRQDEYRQLVKEHLSISEANPAKVMLKQVRIAEIMRDTLIDRRDNPKDDIISLLWATEIDGQPMTQELMEDYSVLLFIAGLDTVVNGMGHGVRHLAMNPDLQERLRANPGLIPEAAEEILRRYTFTIPPRKVAKDTVWEGIELKAGERLMLFLPAADLDPTEFPAPESFDLNRENKVHIAFGTGPHRCLGSHLARIELQVLYEQMLKRLPTWRLDPDNPPTFHGTHVMGPNTVHILWDA